MQNKESSQIKAVLWDYGNVLVAWSPRSYFERVIKDQEKLEFFLENVCPMSWHHLHDCGVPMAQTIPQRQKEFPEFKDEIALWYSNFGEMLLGEIPKSVELVKKLHENNIPQFVLTNMSQDVADVCFDPFPWVKIFKDIIVTGEEQIAKPEREIFELTLARIGYEPYEVFFTDDSPANIETAKSMGIATHLFTNGEKLYQAMVSNNLLIE